MAKGKYAEWLTKEGLIKLEGWARDGLTDALIAKNMNVSEATLYNYKRDHLEILEALKKGKEVVDREVENALLKRALGTVTESTTYKMVRLDDDVLKVKRQRFLNEYKLKHPDMSMEELKMAAIENVPTYQKIPIMVNQNELAPDVSAQIFWLKNRKPDVYRDQSFKALNEAQARKATAEADIKEAEANEIRDGVESKSEVTVVDDIPTD